MSTDSLLMEPHEAAARLRVTARRLNGWADQGLVPVIVTPTGRRMYRPEDIDALVASLAASESA